MKTKSPKRKKRLKKVKLLILLIFVFSLNFLPKFIVRFIDKSSLYNLSINLIIGIFFALFIFILISGKLYKKNEKFFLFVLSQGIIFYFLFTQPRLLDKIILTGFYFAGIYSSNKTIRKKENMILLLIILIVILFEFSGFLFFERNFLYLNILKYFLIVTAGHTSGYLFFKS